MTRKTGVLFVCLGNICRSPLAQGILEYHLQRQNLAGLFSVDSCGTGAWHVGKPAHAGSINIARAHGIDITPQRARQLQPSDLESFDWIIAMDEENFSILNGMKNRHTTARIHLMREFDSTGSPLAVPDPYYTGNFDEVFRILDRCCAKLVAALCQHQEKPSV